MSITLVFVLVALVLLGVLGVLIYAAYQLWIDHEDGKAEREQEQRRVLAAAHRLPRPMSEPASQGITNKFPRVSS